MTVLAGVRAWFCDCRSKSLGGLALSVKVGREGLGHGWTGIPARHGDHDICRVPGRYLQLQYEICCCSPFFLPSCTHALDHVTLLYSRGRAYLPPHGAWAWLCDLFWPMGPLCMPWAEPYRVLMQLGVGFSLLIPPGENHALGGGTSPRRERNRWRFLLMQLAGRR